MIDRNRLNKILDSVETLGDGNEITLVMDNSAREHGYKFSLSVYPRGWWSGNVWTEEQRHNALALLTPFVGKLTKEESNGNIGYTGHLDNLTINLNRVEACKIIGYKTVKKIVKREIEKPVEYEEVEEEERIAITDCDVKQGRATEDDVEVPA